MEDSIILPESTLGLTGLSDVADILRDLVKEGALSPSAFRLTPTMSRIKPEEEQGKVNREEEKKDLRIWMKRKQQERLEDYRKQRQEKRERERLPFTSKFSLKPTSRDLQLYNKKKEEKDKVILQKHHSQRVHEACNLMTEMLTTSLGLPAASTCTTKSQHQVSACTKRSQAQAKGKNRSPTSQRGRSRSVSSLGSTVVLQRRGTSAPPGTLSRRLGLHRPASTLPADRLSQVTRRGMLTDLRARMRTRTPVHRPKVGLNKCVAEPKTLNQRDDREERDVVSPWDVPREIRQILGLESSIQGQGVTEQDEDVLSDGTESILSKLDWADIERIVEEG